MPDADRSAATASNIFAGDAEPYSLNTIPPNVKANARILISRRTSAKAKKERRYFDIYFPNAFIGYFTPLLVNLP
jgi:hypothetical protein